MAATTIINEEDLENLARAVARAHYQADRAADKTVAITADAPVGYLTGACSVEQDIRDEWCSEPDDVVDAALARARYVQQRVECYYRGLRDRS